MSEFEVDAQPMPPREVIEYLEIPLRRPWLCVVPIVAIFLGAIASYLTATRWYLSSTLIIVESEKVPELITRTIIEKSRDRVRVLKEALRSRTRLERIVRELEPYPELTGRKTPSEIVEFMRDLIDIRVKGEDAFAISYMHKNPYLAMAVTNRLATLFIEEAGADRQKQLQAAHGFISTQLEEARLSLERRERDITALKMKHMGSLPEELQSNIAALTRLEMERQTLVTSLSAAKERMILVERSLAEQLAQQIPATSGSGSTKLSSPAAESAARKLLEQLQGELVSLRAKYTDEHPDVRRIQAQVARLEQQLEAEAKAVAEAAALALALAAEHPTEAPIPPPTTASPALLAARNLASQAHLEVQAIQDRIHDAEGRARDLEQRVARTPQVEQELNSLTRDFGKLQTTYQSFLQKKTEAEMAESLEQTWQGERYKMLDPAFLPDRPTSPQLSKYLLIGIGLGLGMGLGASIVAELLDHSIKNARELEAVVPHPVLVTVPHISGRRARGRTAEAGAEA